MTPSVALLRPARTRLGFALQNVVLGALLYGTAKLALALAVFHGANPPLWPVSGVALAGLLLLSPRTWPAVLGASLLVNATEQHSVLTVVGISLANLLAALVPALLLRRLGMRVSLDRLADVLQLFGGVLLSALLGALGGVAALRLGDSHAQVVGTVLFATWFLANLSGLALLTPFLLVWLGPAPEVPPPGRRIEILILLAGLLLAGLVVRAAVPAYALTAFPLLAWAALRFGPRGGATLSLGIFGLSTLATLSGQTPLPKSSVLALSLFFTAFHLSSSATALLLAAAAGERRRARKDERTVDDAYHALIAASPLAIIATDTHGLVTIWNLAAERLLGWRAEEVIGRLPPSIPPELLDEFMQRVSHAERLRVHGRETVRLRADGSLVEVELSDWPLYDAEGRFSGGMAALQEITERKRAERLQEATWRISQAALTAPDLRQLYAAIHAIIGELMPAQNTYIALYDATDDTISFPWWVDETAAVPLPRLLGNGCTDWVIRHGRTLHMREAEADGMFARGEVQMLGTPPADWLGVPLMVAGRPLGALAIQTYDPKDRYAGRERLILEFVSSQVAMAIERKRAEEAMRVSEGELRALFAAMRDVILVLDRQGRYLKVAPTRPDLLAVPADMLVGQRLHDIFPVDQANEFLAAIRQTLASKQPASLEYALTLAGEEVWFSATVSPVDKDTVIWVARSIQEQRSAEAALRRSEDQLRQASKMEAVGRLAGGVAHDFNNLLTSVLGHADLAMSRVDPHDELYDDLLEITSAGVRAAALTQQLLAFSRKQVLAPRIMDLNTIVSGIARMLRRTIGEDIELVTRLAPDLGLVRADPVQMEQVLLNLAVNARDAMPAGGRLTMETLNVESPAGPAVRIRVEDEGVGMPAEVRAHLFEPFFTTKEVGKGTGLGLATAYGIVEQSGGSISVTSEVGRGSCFLVDLPRVDGEPVPAELPARAGSNGGTETVLLVEDEESVRNLTRRVLEHHGYTVLSAPNGESALELSRAHAASIDLLLTDVVMPGMSGPRLAEVLLPERARLRCIFMSGYAATTLEQRILLRSDAAFLQKPFTATELMGMVRDVLDGRASSSAK